MSPTEQFGQDFANTINRALQSNVAPALIVNALEVAKAQIIQTQLVATAAQSVANKILPAGQMPPRFKP